MKTKKECLKKIVNPKMYTNWDVIVGKTVKSVNTDLADDNHIVGISFTDGSEFVIDTDPIGNGLYEPVIDIFENYK